MATPQPRTFLLKGSDFVNKLLTDSSGSSFCEYNIVVFPPLAEYASCNLKLARYDAKGETDKNGGVNTDEDKIPRLRVKGDNQWGDKNGTAHK